MIVLENTAWSHSSAQLYHNTLEASMPFQRETKPSVDFLQEFDRLWI